MGIWEYPFSSSCSLITATRPSIISDGATISAPALACDTAVRAKYSNVGSFITSPSLIIPQCPWLVNSQRQTSVITSSSGYFSLITLIACCTIPSSTKAPVPNSSFSSGIPNSIIAGIPNSTTSPTAGNSLSIEYWNTPGMEETSFAWSFPYITNIG